jgi:hypothetical protein
LLLSRLKWRPYIVRKSTLYYPFGIEAVVVKQGHDLIHDSHRPLAHPTTKVPSASLAGHRQWSQLIKEILQLLRERRWLGLGKVITGFTERRKLLAEGTPVLP